MKKIASISSASWCSFIFFISLNIIIISKGLAAEKYFVSVKEASFIDGDQTDEDDGFFDYLMAELVSNESNKFSLGWIPAGSNFTPLRPECQVSKLKRRSLNSGLSARELEKLNQQYFANCGSDLRRYRKSGFRALFKAVDVDYDVQKHPRVSKIKIQFENGTSIFGLLALKKGKDRRPWVIARCGIICRGRGSRWTRTMMMHFFDSSPFNVILLASQTGSNVAIENRRVLIGGVHEGQETMAIGHWLKTESAFKNYVSSVHSVGYSLGGHSALYTALYEEIYRQRTGEKVFNSVIASCPVVRLKPTLDNLFNGSRLGKVLGLAIWRNIVKVLPFVPELRSEIDGDSRPPISDLPRIVGSSAIKSLSKIPSGEFLPPFTGFDLESLNDFWRQADFSLYSRNLSVSTLIWAAENDGFVNYDLNTGFLKESLAKEDRGGIQLLTTKDGSHCAMDVSYGWETMAHVFQSHVLRNSPEFLKKRKLNKIEAYGFSPLLAKGELHTAQRWLLQPGADFAEIEFQIFKGREGGRKCFKEGPFAAKLKKCYRLEKVKVALSNLPFEINKVPLNKVEAQALNRWINNNFWLEAKGQSINGTDYPVDSIRWISF